jgi:hypothetical protein
MRSLVARITGTCKEGEYFFVLVQFTCLLWNIGIIFCNNSYKQTILAFLYKYAFCKI